MLLNRFFAFECVGEYVRIYVNRLLKNIVFNAAAYFSVYVGSYPSDKKYIKRAKGY
jgi:hypothetical protein